MDVFQQVLIIGKVWPEPASSAAGTRMMQLVDFFKSRSEQVTFASTANKTGFQINLEELGVEEAEVELNASSFDDFVRALSPSLVVFDRFMTEEQFGWRVAETCPDAVRVLDTEDLHFLREARSLALKRGKTLSLENNSALMNEKTLREVASILRCDLTLLVSEVEMNLLKNTFQLPEHVLHYLPISASVESVSLPAYENRRDFLFIGNFLHEPNWDAVRYLKVAIWPVIRQLMPQARVYIYGAYASQKVFDLHDEKTGFLVQGRAENAQEVTAQARVVLAPLRFGAGIKGKLLEAMHCGTPAVTSSIGAESMHDEGRWNGYICDTVDDFAEAAVKLYRDKEQWEIAQRQGFDILKNRFSAEMHWPAFHKELTKVGKDILSHRNQSVFSRLLQHQTLLSNKYMSRWIEVKEKLAKQ